MSEIRHTVGEIIKRRRQEIGLSRREVARRAGVNDSTIVRIENGDIANPRSDMLQSLATALNLSYADLFAAAGYNTPDGLPSFEPYLRAKYGDLPLADLAELERRFAAIERRHGARGPVDREDEH
jgi:transcriptional regulator with XRE-family HTH domain